MSHQSAFRHARCLVTGGLGFIGSNLVHRLVDLGATVHVVDSLHPDHGGNRFNIADLEGQVRLDVKDLRDRDAIGGLIEGQDFIFNLAGQVSHLDSMRDPYTDLEANCLPHLILLEACRARNPGVKIVYTSTRQVYGQPDYLPVDERHPIHPSDINGIHKMAGERYHTIYNDVHGVRTTSLRLTNTYGPRQLMRHNRQGFVPWFIRLAIDEQEIVLYGDGQQRRDFNYVDDVVDALLRAAANERANGKVFNLGASPAVSLQSFTDQLIRVVGTGRYRFAAFPADRKAIDIGDYYADYGKIEEMLGWRPQVSLGEGLGRTVEYYRRHRQHYW
jgi:UDP-glucose 4-epimerase